jgi:hypothetical protein
MKMNKHEIIRDLLENGRASDLQEMMEGESKYNRGNADAIAITDKLGARSKSMALHYVRFVAKFGRAVSEAELNGKTYFARPNDFDSWLSRGAPGISEDELSNYLAENPL